VDAGIARDRVEGRAEFFFRPQKTALTEAAYGGTLGTNSMQGGTVNRRGSVLVLVATLLGGCAGIALAQTWIVTPWAAARSVASSEFALRLVPVASAFSGYVLTAASPSPSLATATAVLTQEAKDRWQTTVILSQAAGEECPGPTTDYWLETTGPDLARSASSVIRATPYGPCLVTVTFNVPLGTPGSALLVLDESGVLSSTQLSLSRDVSKLEYYGVPVICGAVMVLALLELIRRGVRVDGRDGTPISLFKSQFWQQIIPVSNTDNLKVSGVSVATVLGTFIAAAALANSLFPGVSLSSFVILSIIAGMIVAAGSGLSGFLYRRWLGSHPVDLAGTTLEFDPSGSARAVIKVPSGAKIAVPEGAKIFDKGGKDRGAPDPITQVPADGEIQIVSGRSLYLSAGADLLLKGKCSIQIDHDSGRLQLADGSAIGLPMGIDADSDVTITYTNEADIEIPAGTKISRDRQVRKSTRAERYKLLPSRSSRREASMTVVVGPALCTMFGIGAELGLVGVLAVILSDGGFFTRIMAGVLIVAVAFITLYYSFKTIQTAARDA
jgi:hypothetical protein